MEPDVLNLAAMALKIQYLLGMEPSTPTPYVGLFDQPLELDCATELSEFTFAAGTPYDPVILSPSAWDIVEDDVSCVVTASYPPVTWSFTAGTGTIYGHYVYDPVNEECLWAGLWATPYAVPSAGGQVTVTLNLTDQQCPASSSTRILLRRRGTR